MRSHASCYWLSLVSPAAPAHAERAADHGKAAKIGRKRKKKGPPLARAQARVAHEPRVVWGRALRVRLAHSRRRRLSLSALRWERSSSPCLSAREVEQAARARALPNKRAQVTAVDRTTRAGYPRCARPACALSSPLSPLTSSSQAPCRRRALPVGLRPRPTHRTPPPGTPVDGRCDWHLLGLSLLVKGHWASARRATKRAYNEPTTRGYACCVMFVGATTRGLSRPRSPHARGG